MQTSKFVPLATIIGGFLVLIIDAFEFSIGFEPSESMFNALIYAGLGSSAAVGFAKHWKKKE